MWLGSKANRDYNAFLNILKTGAGRPVAPVERIAKKIPQTISYKEVVLGQVFLVKQKAPRKRKG